MKINTDVLKKEKKSSLLRSLGPVEQLEAHVHPEWWRYIFNSLYIKTDGDVVEDDEITKNEIDIFISMLNMQKEAQILDVCCGQGRHSFELYKEVLLMLKELTGRLT